MRNYQYSWSTRLSTKKMSERNNWLKTSWTTRERATTSTLIVKKQNDLPWKTTGSVGQWPCLYPSGINHLPPKVQAHLWRRRCLGPNLTKRWRALAIYPSYTVSTNTLFMSLLPISRPCSRAWNVRHHVTKFLLASHGQKHLLYSGQVHVVHKNRQANKSKRRSRLLPRASHLYFFSIDIQGLLPMIELGKK